MHASFVLDIIFYAIALLLFVAYFTFCKKSGLQMFKLCYVKQTLAIILRKRPI
jgi:hypothetical protein